MTLDRKHRTFHARCLLKSEEAANALARALAFAGVQARISVYAWGNRRYWLIYLTNRMILKLAERCESWRSALKELTEKKGLPKHWKRAREPVYATLGEYRFHLRSRGGHGGIFARSVFKSEEEVKRCAEELEKRGIKVNVYKWHPYWYVEINGHGVLKLTEQNEEWRKALKEYIEKKGAPTRGPVSRKLLELVESPPPKLLTPSSYSLSAGSSAR